MERHYSYIPVGNLDSAIVLWSTCFALVFSLTAMAQGMESLDTKYPLIPGPKEIHYGPGEIEFGSYDLKTDGDSNEIRHLSEFLTGEGIDQSSDGLGIYIQYEDPNLPHREAYSLKIDTAVHLSARSGTGIFYGIQSLKQLFRKKGGQGVFPKLELRDWPSFEVRGFMHDTGRNFQSVAQLKQQIEVLASYKYNVFHWHLTDNPGWRLESKKYPQLQSKEAFSRDIGQFYGHEDFLDILAFCRERKITLIPEFDIPGHTAAFRRAF